MGLNLILVNPLRLKTHSRKSGLNSDGVVCRDRPKTQSEHHTFRKSLADHR